MGRKLAVVSLVMALCFTNVACIGRMAVTREVSRFNLSVAEGRAGREITFFLLHVVPVYPLAYLLDIFIINSIEFWGGENPVSGETRLARVGESKTMDGPGGERVVSSVRDDGSLDVEMYAADGSAHFVNLVRRDDTLVARDGAGNVVGELDADGAMRLGRHAELASAVR